MGLNRFNSGIYADTVYFRMTNPNLAVWLALMVSAVGTALVQNKQYSAYTQRLACDKLAPLYSIVA